jgi:uncharacterized membrane protein
MRRAFGDTLVSVIALGAVLATLILVDDRVREQVSLRFSGRTASMEFHEVGRRASDIGGVVMLALRDRGLEHGPILIFALAAVVLVVFMLRT